MNKIPTTIKTRVKVEKGEEKTTIAAHIQRTVEIIKPMIGKKYSINAIIKTAHVGNGKTKKGKTEQNREIKT